MALPEVLTASLELVKKEDRLREAFSNEATVTNPEKGYVSVPSVNQLINLEMEGWAADLIAFHFQRTGIFFDKVVGIPNSGISLSHAVAQRLKVPLAPGRKGSDIPGAWKMPIVINETAPSFTTGKASTFVFNGIEYGDTVLAVEDVIAQGDTMTLIADKFRQNGVDLYLASYFAKTFQGGVDRLREIGIEPYYAVGIERLEESDGEYLPILEPPKLLY